MAIQKIYLETTMFSFYHEERTAGDYPKRREEARRVFDIIKTGKFEPYTSTYALEEFAQETNEAKRKKMNALISEYGVKVFDVITDEVKRLSELYITEEAMTLLSSVDAAHVAITTVNGLDFIVSLNFGHIVRPWTIERVRIVNAREGYKGIGIYKPKEVIEIYEDNQGLFERYADEE